MEKVFLTIIVPAYNVEKYLSKCLDSLVNQTIIAHKVIVINDGSTDSTLDIIKQYTKKYPNIISFIDQENKGLGAARNVGMSKVETPFVTCLDSDDWQDIMFVEKVKNVLDKYDEAPDIIFTLPWIFDTSTRQVQDWHDRYTFERIFFPNGGDENKISVITNVSNNKMLYELEASTNRRIYRTEFIKRINLKYTEGKKWEDVKPHFVAIHSAERCIGLKNTGFFYRVNTDNQITAGNGKTRLDVIDVFGDVLDTAFNGNWSEIEIAYILRMLWNFSTWSINVTNSEYIDELLNGLHKLFNTIPNKYFNIYFNNCSPHRRKEFVKTWIIKSPFYVILKDYRVRNYVLKIVARIRR